MNSRVCQGTAPDEPRRYAGQSERGHEVGISGRPRHRSRGLGSAGSGPGCAGDRAGDAAPPGRSAIEPAEAALVLEIWQELVGATLSPDGVRRFRAHPDFMVLCHYDRRRLEVAGRQLYGRTGRLLLAEWARECAWDGGGSINLSWAELAAGDPGRESWHVTWLPPWSGACRRHAIVPC